MIELHEIPKITSYVVPDDMIIGDVGIIRGHALQSYIGWLVFKANADILIALNHIGYWTNLQQKDFQIEILPEGTLFKVTKLVKELCS